MTVLRWIGRILGLLIIAFVLLMAIGQGFDPRGLNGTELAMSLALLTSLVGMGLAWRWELVGGLLSLIGMFGFYLINFAAAGRFPGGPIFPLCFVPGAIAIFCGWRVPLNRAS